MLYIYRRAASEGATLLTEDIMLQGTRARRTQGRMLRENLAEGDTVICWGESLNGIALRVPLDRIKTLNNVPVVSKFTEAQTLAQAGVPTVRVSQTRPAPVQRPAFVAGEFVLGNGGAIRYNVADAEILANRLTEFVTNERQRRAEYEAQPVVQDTWLPRRNNHVGGSDLLRGVQQPDYYSKKENIVEEYRLHMFKGRSIRAGVKRPAQDVPNVHEWIRSYDAGWRINYANFASTRDMRDLGKKALEALQLDFGAVDMGRKADGSLIVLEVNRAPGVEGGTSDAYARHIISWLNAGA